jgi:hypothetical protein
MEIIAAAIVIVLFLFFIVLLLAIPFLSAESGINYWAFLKIDVKIAGFK